MTLSHRLPPSPSQTPKLVSSSPTASAPANVRISHVQLRDLIVCPSERGVLWYVTEDGIVEQDILSSTPAQQRTIASLKFTPVTLSTLRLASSCPSGNDVIILAAGGQDAELFLAMYTYHPRRTREGKRPPVPLVPLQNARSPVTHDFQSSEKVLLELDGEQTELDVTEEEVEEEHAGYSTSVWQHSSSLVGSINNNVLLYMPPPLADHDLYEDSEEPRVVSPRLVVSNNDCTVKFFDVSLARKGLRSPMQRPQERGVDTRYWRQEPGYGYRGVCEGEGWDEKGTERILRYERVGCLRLPVPVNHTSISPDGSTVLSCGDASTIYLHRILPVRDGSSLLFEPLATYSIPPPTPLPPPPPSATISSATFQSRSYIPSLPGYNDPGGAYLPFAFVNGAWVLAGPHPFLNDTQGMDIPPACFTTAWSADGMRFAVASQEGMIRVWDVRSKEPLACAGWETGPGSAFAESSPGGNGRADGSTVVMTGYDAQRALLESSGTAPPWGVRSLKFAINASGREVLAFTEHVSRVHVVDAYTFSRHDVLRIPHVQPSASQPLPVREHHRHHRRPTSTLSTRFPVFRPPPTSGSTPVAAPTIEPSVATQLYAISPADLPAWIDGANYIPRFVIDTSAVWRGSRDDAPFPRPAPGNEGGGIPASRLASRLEGRMRARRLGLVPPRLTGSEFHENNTGSGPSRILYSPNHPLSRSPDPTVYRNPLSEQRYTPDDDAFNSNSNSDTDYQTGRTMGNRSAGPGIGFSAQRAGGRIGIRRRVLNRLEDEELRRRTPAPRSRDDAQLEEDIALHATLERERQEEREHDTAQLRSMIHRAREHVEILQSQLRDGSRPPLRSEGEQERRQDRSQVSNSAVSQNPGSRRSPLVIPRLSSNRSEEDVRNVLAAHGISSVRSRMLPAEREVVGGFQNEQARSQDVSIPNLAMQDPDEQRPGSSSSSSASASSTSAATSVSAVTGLTGVSTRAQSGSVTGERPAVVSGTNSESSVHEPNEHTDPSALLTPSMQDMRAGQAAFRETVEVVDDYSMEVDDDADGEGEDSDATELDCTEPSIVGRLPESMAGISPVSPSGGSAEGSTTSRTSSTLPSSTIPSTTPSSASSSTVNTSPSHQPSTPSSTPNPPQSQAQSQSLPPFRELIEATDRLDIAGIAFDPSGAYMYVATVDGITEWAIQGVEQRWWHSSGCL